MNQSMSSNASRMLLGEWKRNNTIIERRWLTKDERWFAYVFKSGTQNGYIYVLRDLELTGGSSKLFPTEQAAMDAADLVLREMGYVFLEERPNLRLLI